MWDKYNQTGVELGYFKQQTKMLPARNITSPAYKTTLFHTFKVNTSMLTSSRPEIRFMPPILKRRILTSIRPRIIPPAFLKTGRTISLPWGAQAEIWW
ncbi:carbohydrate porin [Klebsiella pneumoniae]|nr:carbohydrate porin [Klebsiella pneumoniae]